ncbi:uncharacterized protein LOC141701712 [Apium graveolens]|uniref:uncharacterized protein LOC141701712 n=1 Tax=Apium graveolens TaxID=4045 RepID=UPI003D78C420
MGFRNGCRPLLGLDGCHLKGPYGGQLLAAVATDANDGMYPLAWAVVETENNDSWNWFLESLKSDMWIENDGAFTFISDIQKGLINALEAVFPNAEHRFCVMHLYRNMWKEHKGIGLSRKCFEWLSEKPRSQWYQSAFGNLCRSDMFVNNHCEVFNSIIRKYRDLPIISILKAIHNDVMVRIQKRRDKMLNSYALNPVCPNAMRRLDKYLVIMSAGGYEMVVDLEAHNCVCKKWGLSGIPCYHACACIAWSKKPYEPFIHMSYTKDTFLECYSNIVEPIVGETEWTETPYPRPLPPEKKVQPGRPKKNNALTQAHDRANGCEKVVKVRTKTPKKPQMTSDGQDASTEAGGGGTTNEATFGVSKRTIAEDTQGWGITKQK